MPEGDEEVEGNWQQSVKLRNTTRVVGGFICLDTNRIRIRPRAKQTNSTSWEVEGQPEIGSEDGQ